ncbi:hypothetical protein IFJ82_04500 [Novacetimonas hansenii]|uniref:Uncharacterized protein n=2 Tax=Novacetimonas hansenii TaxID=436 RepID=A0AAW5ER39_NOVHA|nr:hypothetical protein [Novacetimonas hansenii]EFG82780.1 hypothetical protein GXY_16658 [Novacetimonas hansenii ATCC 23769]MBL7235133.1 hypothetical protein [Novacetimonas hansenii]MCJ8353172.1 hypothetical protein [Novacetimonas hansenii]PYD73048.1 hypothetical protein CFR74_05950 [Novacetimonas hansenii]QOF95890.1 hypothetical protein IFJ82_04500 [Novacetimonas hansenii]
MSLSFWRAAAAGLALAGLVNSGHALAAGPCSPSPAHEAFDVQGLKSELMVTALSCGAQDKYNSFVTKFRPKLAGEEKVLTAYFRTTYGRSAQRQHDDYITQLANVQSERGLKSGTAFCQQRMSMFDEVQVLESAADLSNYAQAKDILQPASYLTCTAPNHPAPAATRSSTRSTRRTVRS